MNKLTVVMYHYVRNVEESRYPEIKGLELDFFIKQLSFFKENYNVVAMEDVILSFGGKSLPPKPLLLTFDDGYAEHFNLVYPALRDFGIRGSFFVPVKAIVEHELLDVNDVNDIVDDIRLDVLAYKNQFNLKGFDGYFNELALANRFDTKEVIFVKRMLQYALPEELRSLLSSKYFEKYVGMNEKVFAKELYMNESQIKQLVRDGMHVGCHGYDHYWWNKLDSDSLEMELMKSKEFLSSIGCDMSQWTACYPYGSSSDSVVKELEFQGCKLAFTTEVKVAEIDNHSKLLIPRLDTNDFPPNSDNYKNY